MRYLLLRQRGFKVLLRYHSRVEQELSQADDLYLLMGHGRTPLLVQADARHVDHFGRAGRDVKYIGDGDEGHL